MFTLLRVLGLTALLTLASCGGGSGAGGDGGSSPRKSVLSHWTLVDYDYYSNVDIRGATIDLRHGALGRDFALDFSYNGSVFCTTRMRLTGGEYAGVYRMEGISCGTLDYQEGTYQVASNSELKLKGLKTKFTDSALITSSSTEIYR